MDPAAPPPVVIGVLGAIGSGKSTAARVLAEAGAAWIDADRLAHAALEEPAIRDALLTRHGRSIAQAGSPGVIDRAALGRLAFADPAARAHLESLVHPQVRAAIAEALAGHRFRRDVPAIVLDVPLLLESSPFAGECDLLLFVEAGEGARRERVAARHGWGAAELARRDSTQLAPAAKRERAHVVLRNDGDLDAFAARVREWLAASGGFAALRRRGADSDQH